jgi:hypothetical protein
MNSRSDVDLTKEDRDRLKASPIRYDTTNRNFFWEGIPNCLQNKCPIYSTCQYPKAGACGLRKRYLSVIERLILGCLETKSPRNKLKVGFHLIPLYNQLFSAKIKNVAEETTETSREIRAILRSIEAVFKSLAKKKMVPGEEAQSTPESDYYDQMSDVGYDEAKGPAPVTPITKRKQKRGPKPKVNVEDLEKEFGLA